jgi:cyclomaltodextrinase
LITRCAAMLIAAAIASVLLGHPAAADTPVLALNGDGGDAWAFHRRVEGRLVSGSCGDVAIMTPAGEFRATLVERLFAANVGLRAGVNEVRAVCRDGDSPRASSQSQPWRVRIADKPKALARAVVTHAGLVLDAGGSELAPASPVPLTRYEWRIGEDNAPFEPILGRRVVVDRPLADGDHLVRLRVTDGLGRADEAATMVHVQGGRARSVDLASEHPDWVDSAVIYGAVPFLFGPRGLADVTERLDAIAALGATAIWLTPITESPGHDFGYAVTDHFAVRRAYGTEADLRTLVRKAHERGLRVLLDFVPNHVSDQHPYHADTIRRGAASAYADFFDRDAEGRVTNYFDWSNLKNLNFDNSEVQRYVIEAFAYWVREFAVDGFRVDASWGIRERAPEFWPRWRAELKRIKPDLFLLAEASARDPFYVQHGFDAAYDWTERLGEWAWKDAFDGRERPVDALKAAIRAIGGRTASAASVLRFLENNDTGPRFVTRHGPEYARVAAAMLLTLPGIPMIFTGQEIGAEFEPYAAPQPVDWSRDPHQLRATYKKLLHLRAANPPLRGTAVNLLETDQKDRILAYVRPGVPPERELIIVLNFSDEPVNAAVHGSHGAAAEGRFIDLMSGEIIAVAADGPGIAMPASSARILRRTGP